MHFQKFQCYLHINLCSTFTRNTTLLNIPFLGEKADILNGLYIIREKKKKSVLDVDAMNFSAQRLNERHCISQNLLMCTIVFSTSNGDTSSLQYCVKQDCS